MTSVSAQMQLYLYVTKTRNQAKNYKSEKTKNFLLHIKTKTIQHSALTL